MYNKDMPAKSQAQQNLMAVALHEPSKLYSKNKGVLKMGKKSLSDFARTPSRGLPRKIGKSAAFGSSK